MVSTGLFGTYSETVEDSSDVTTLNWRAKLNGVIKKLDFSVGLKIVI